MDYDNNGQADAQDDKTITILGTCYTGGSADAYAMGAMSADTRLRGGSPTVFRFR